MLLLTPRPSNTTFVDPRKVFPFAVFGISHVHTAAPPVTPALCARSRTFPTRPTHVTRPFWRTAPVSDRAAVSRSVNGFPATGAAGVVVTRRTTSVGLAMLTV